MKTCNTCKWYEGDHCHYLPPVVQVIMAQTMSGVQPQPISVHPPVRPNNFCSKHSGSFDSEVIDV